MHSTELIQNVDIALNLGKSIQAAGTAVETTDREGLNGIDRFYRSIQLLTEEVYGRGSQVWDSFDSIAAENPDKVEHGMRLLRDLRTLVAYSGEFSS